MSSMPTLPSGTGDRLKSFWSRPEGKTGILVILGVGALALWGWGQIVGYLVSMLADTVHMAVLAAELAAILWIAFSERSHLIFRLLMRAMTGIIINIDPIGILKDRLQQMKKRREVMGEQISNVSGQERILKDTIAKNHELADQKMKLSAYAERVSGTAQTPEDKLRYDLQKTLNANKAVRLEKSNISYADLLKKISALREMLTKFAINIDFFIEDTEDTVNQQEMTYKTVNAAFKAYRTAMSIIKGNANESELYNETMQHLADDASTKLGYIDDFQRVAQSFMDGVDLQNGAVQEEALQKLNDYQAKLLTSGSQGEAALFQTATAQPIPVPVAVKK